MAVTDACPKCGWTPKAGTYEPIAAPSHHAMVSAFDRRALIRGLAIVALAAALIFSRQLAGVVTKSGFGGACAEGPDCRSGLCLPSGTCTEFCSIGSCDEGWACEDVTVTWRGQSSWRTRPEARSVCVPALEPP